MKAIATLIIILGISLSSQPTARGQEYKKEQEIKVNLTKEGHDYLLDLFTKDYNSGEKIRHDYYFELFENNEYQLYQEINPIKIRLMSSEESLRWQIQKMTRSESYSIFNFKETESMSIEIKKDFSNLINQIAYYNNLLLSENPLSLYIANTIQSKLEALKLISLSQKLCIICSPDKKFFPSHFNKKKRTKIKLTLENIPFNVQLGETINSDKISYELEVEINHTDNPEKFIAIFESWLRSKNFKDQFIDLETSVSPAKKTEYALKKLYHF